jgi:hypothetical protein
MQIRRSAKILAVALCLVVAVDCLSAQEAQSAFNWAFVKRTAEGVPAPVDFKERVSITTGDFFKIYVQPVRNAYIYLFLHDAQGDLQLLFPGSFSLFDSGAYLDASYLIPSEDNWFTLDNATGTERFYLVASSERLRPLEAMVVSYRNASGAAKETTREAVLDEIARVRRQHSELIVAAEKPVTVAGGTRGIATAIQKVATRIEAPGFYYKLFRLEH